MTEKNRGAVICEHIALALCAITALMLLVELRHATPAMPVAAVAGQLLAMVGLCIAHAATTRGWRKALGFSIVSALLSWFFEYIGCNFGWWFGDYAYTPALGLAIGNVPLLVVVSWEVIIYPSLLIVDELMPTPPAPATTAGWWLRALAASLATAMVTTAWDLMTDPISVTRGWWLWDHGGAYMPAVRGGVPFSNFAGWVGAVFLISLIYRVLFTRAQPGPASTSSLRFAAPLYTAMLFGGLLGLHQAALPLTMFVGLFAMGPVAALAWSRLAACGPGQGLSTLRSCPARARPHSAVR
ncbi:carotenoid biosynthesis protein [Solimonas terrae]|uniref:Carotenoid biosynthesis protein n=1 Tax=Solimonas terrae TaxID=1396819 RepID=A0A6M2BQB7_9GAMM|nr:carotenoid biosynthesis protein [Solimonas terrae]NGY04279.1 carotenoid biosynthesis protein [Solimonas terrae]